MFGKNGVNLLTSKTIQALYVDLFMNLSYEYAQVKMITRMLQKLPNDVI